MLLFKKNPITNGLRHQIVLQKNLLSKTNRLIKSLLLGSKKKSGRSTVTGRITVRHKGGGVKRCFRYINTSNEFVYSITIAICYDPFKNSFISLQYDFLKNIFFYNKATNLVLPGALISCSSKFNGDFFLGSRFQIKNIPTGSLLHSLSIKNNKIKYIRSAGSFGQLIQKDFIQSKIRLPSGKIFVLSTNNYATLGVSSNLKFNLISIGKAGKNRLKGKRPSVRGIAMNPVDHPHGGRTNGGCVWVTPWGIPTKGKSTKKK
jgi:large subunit ribosomal protein L2